MPRNRQHIPRDERVSDLVKAASRVFVKKGYSATTMADLSNAAGVARANFYWYFPSKDDVFAEVMDRMLEDEVDRLKASSGKGSAYDDLTTGLREMYGYRSLHREMHERIPHSAAVAAAHQAFIDWLRALAVKAAEEADSDVDPMLVGDLVVVIFEGSHTPSVTTIAHELIPRALDVILK